MVTLVYKPFDKYTYLFIVRGVFSKSDTHRKEIRIWYKNFKKESCCLVCGKRKKLQFHHVDPKTKKDTVSNLVHKSASTSEIAQEINKCVILCSKCHRKVHDGKMAILFFK